METKQKQTVLFIGNSFTFVNDLPGMLAEMFEQAGLDYQVESLTKGGWYLSRYADPQDKMGEQLYRNYVGKHWDYVILQDQSFNPVKNFEDFLAGARTLCEVLKPGKVLFYQTWAYEDGSEKLAETGLTYDEMYRKLKEAYRQAAELLGGVLVPVGDQFAQMHDTQPEVKLYKEDSFHPAEAGTRLAAGEFFKAVSGMEWKPEVQERRFVNYAHRGASEYTPENTMLAFYTGMYMGANGIETDVQMTKDGVLVLFHDNTIMRLTGEEGRIQDYTLEELRHFTFEKNGQRDKIVVFEEFLQQFGWRDITFAIEIKQAGIEPQIADMIRVYGIGSKTVVTSFMPECIQAIKAYAPELSVGLLKRGVTDETIEALKAMGAAEVCPHSAEVSPEKVNEWHAQGLRVRAWGVGDEKAMRKVYDAMADGMTVNFPDKLTAYIKSK